MKLLPFDTRILETAIHQARKSLCHFKHGAVLFTPKGDVVSVAHNTWAWHAEARLLKKIPRHLRERDIYILVVRVNGNGELQMSSPCESCRRKISRSPIRRVYYSLNEEEVE